MIHPQAIEDKNVCHSREPYDFRVDPELLDRDDLARLLLLAVDDVRYTSDTECEWEKKDMDRAHALLATVTEAEAPEGGDRDDSKDSVTLTNIEVRTGDGRSTPLRFVLFDVAIRQDTQNVTATVVANAGAIASDPHHCLYMMRPGLTNAEQVIQAVYDSGMTYVLATNLPHKEAEAAWHSRTVEANTSVCMSDYLQPGGTFMLVRRGEDSEQPDLATFAVDHNRNTAHLLLTNVRCDGRIYPRLVWRASVIDGAMMLPSPSYIDLTAKGITRLIAWFAINGESVGHDECPEWSPSWRTYLWTQNGPIKESLRAME